jgi:hypothetical protein
MFLQVSVPQYIRLMSIQNETIKLDRMMKELAKIHTPQQLMADHSWREMVLIHRAMEKLLPDDVKKYFFVSGPPAPLPTICNIQL